MALQLHCRQKWCHKFEPAKPSVLCSKDCLYLCDHKALIRIQQISMPHPQRCGWWYRSTGRLQLSPLKLQSCIAAHPDGHDHRSSSLTRLRAMQNRLQTINKGGMPCNGLPQAKEFPICSRDQVQEPSRCQSVANMQVVAHVAALSTQACTHAEDTPLGYFFG